MLELCLSTDSCLCLNVSWEFLPSCHTQGVPKLVAMEPCWGSRAGVLTVLLHLPRLPSGIPPPGQSGMICTQPTDPHITAQAHHLNVLLINKLSIITIKWIFLINDGIYVGHREFAIFCKIKSLKSVYILIVSLCINCLQLLSHIFYISLTLCCFCYNKIKRNCISLWSESQLSCGYLSISA